MATILPPSMTIAGCVLTIPTTAFSYSFALFFILPLFMKSTITTSPESTSSEAGKSSAISTKLLHVAEPPESLQFVPLMLKLPVL